MIAIRNAHALWAIFPCLVLGSACDDDEGEGTVGTNGVTSTGGTGGSTSGSTQGTGGTAGSAGFAGDSGASGEGGAAGDRSVFRPEIKPFSNARLEQLSLPTGFAINVYAEDLGHARMLAVHREHVYLTRPMQGDVLRLVDQDGDGVSESTVSVVTDKMQVHGIAFSGDSIFLATDKQVFRGEVANNGNVSQLMPLGDELPDGGQHPLRTLGVGPDSKLYLSVGSNCDACEQLDPELATMLSVDPDTGERTVLASGLRNTIGFDWHPETDALWGMDHGSDWRGDDLPPEELNRIQSGKDYGWPYCFGKRELDPVIEDPPGSTKEAYCAMTTASIMEYQAHGAPIGMTFYDGSSFPAEYSGDAFVAMHGSWNRFPPTGYSVVRVRFDSGEPVAFEDFLSGFLIEDGEAAFGRPAGIAVAPDGALLVSDDTNGMVYRISYEEP